MFEQAGKFFELEKHGSSFRTEISAGITIFLAMSYILFVQPQVLGAAGLDKGAVFTSTCIASALACLMMGLVARLPIAQAPLMGENFFFAYTVVLGMGYSWRQGLSMVLVSGILFFALNLTKIRQRLIAVIPASLKFGISAGIGLFITFIGLKEMGLVTANQATLVQLGPIHQPEVLAGICGFFLTAGLFGRKVPGAILWGMTATAAALWIMGTIEFGGIISMPPSITPTLFQFDFSGLWRWQTLSVVLILLFMMIFDTMGTLIGLGVQAGLVDREGTLKNIPRALMTDALATTAGAMLGNSTVSSYIESSTGIAQGGRTGLTAVTAGLCFLLALFISPLLTMFGGTVTLPGKLVIQPVTAPALVMVGALMMSGVRHINWAEFSEFVPAFLIIALIPLTYNIADGIAIGFISYPVLKLLTGGRKEVSWEAWALALVFVVRYIFFTEG
ncbi:MAG: NCS2 family permease [Elusimicrobiaceae bacterium]|nr:NCS2 family permease [Elusimicrobiaceae bacterium]